MDVFITWSGEGSKELAQTLQTWLRRVLQSAEPWISTEMGKGTRWNEEVAVRLRSSKVGIICLTRDNLEEPWVNFEAGAISNTSGALACTLLIDLSPSDVPPPLGQFQHTVATEEDVRRLVGDINRAAEEADERCLEEKDLDAIFDRFWPELRAKLEEIKSRPAQRQRARPEREMMEEVLELVRAQARRTRAEVITSKATFEEGGTYVMKNGALRPINSAWIMKDGRWQPIRIGEKPPPSTDSGES